MSENAELPGTDGNDPDPADDPGSGTPRHLAPDDAGERPWVDPAKDPTPGRPGHLAPDSDV